MVMILLGVFVVLFVFVFIEEVTENYVVPALEDINIYCGIPPGVSAVTTMSWGNGCDEVVIFFYLIKDYSDNCW